MITSRDILKLAMHNGAIIGGILVGITILFYFAGLLHTPNDASTFFSVIAMLVGIFITTKKIRKNNNNVISFRHAYYHGVLTSLFSSFIIAVFIMVLYAADGSLLEKYIQLVETNSQQIAQTLSTVGMEDKVDIMIDELDKMKNEMNAKGYAFNLFFVYLIISITGSLIISAIVQKKNNTFDNSITDNQSLS